MKKMLLVTFLLVASLKGFSQDLNPGGTMPTDPQPMPRCGMYCFKNMSDCYTYVCFSAHEHNPCGDEGILSVPVYTCLSLEPGQEGCIDLGLYQGTECYLCPLSYTISICGNNSYPCFSFGETEYGGRGLTKCGDIYSLTSCNFDFNTGKYIITRP